MQFVISSSALKKELAFVQGIVERKNVIPVLANILIESTSEDTVRISGTDLDVTIRTDVTAESIQTPGAICIQARKLFDIARLLPDAPVTFTKEENEWVAVKCGKSNFRLPGIAKETFPELPATKATPFAINSAVLKTLINQTIFAITQEEGRYTLSGAKFELKNDSIRVVTTDGHRLALVEINEQLKNPKGEVLDLLIPRKTLSELTKLATDFDGDIAFGADENHVYFQVGTRTIVSRLLSGQFPNYEMVLPKTNDQLATFDTATLIKALRRVALMADDRSRAILLKLEKDQATVSSQTPEEGEADETVPVEFAGATTIISFNASYLQDFLNVIDTAKVLFEFKDPNSQALLRPENSETTKFVIMPMRTP